MGVGRLLAKGWLVFCLFAGAHAIADAVSAKTPALQAVAASTTPVFLFGAMGVLFIAGYALSSGHLISRFKPLLVVPGFNEIVFVAFAAVCFTIQVASPHVSLGVAESLQSAIHFAVPGQRALDDSLARCNLDGGRAISSAASWLLALVFLGSMISRARIAAALVRLERKHKIEPLGPTGIASVLGLAAVAGIQLLFVGSIFRWLTCGELGGVLGQVLIGAGPLVLSYLIGAALANLLAMTPED